MKKLKDIFGKGESEMYVYGLVGPSGTGKSHRAPWVAKEKDIDFIIDDGLLIKGNNVIAGKSAKKEKTRLASVKRLFLQTTITLSKFPTSLKCRTLKSSSSSGPQSTWSIRSPKEWESKKSMRSSI